MIQCVAAMETALLPCLPAGELQAIDRSSRPSLQIDVERHASDFMEAAKKLQLYLTALQHEDKPNMAGTLKRIAAMEEELKEKEVLIEKYDKLIQGWRKDVQAQLKKHKNSTECNMLARW
ncbi:hypothetical protein Leryth_026835 [Lithospermum erythrorhizon]|nr:hypothetical protein Leryth_026835 [Lithospermum erythrorhizon]